MESKLSHTIAIIGNIKLGCNIVAENITLILQR